MADSSSACEEFPRAITQLTQGTGFHRPARRLGTEVIVRRCGDRDVIERVMNDSNDLSDSHVIDCISISRRSQAIPGRLEIMR